MAATVSIAETNGVGVTVTAAVSNINFGSVDQVNLTPSARKIVKGTNSFVKYLRVNVTAMGGSNNIDTMQWWKSAGAYKTGEVLNVTNTTQGGYTAVTYATPTAATMAGGNPISTASLGVNNNIKIAGSFGGVLIAAGFSDYFSAQLVTTAATETGAVNQKTLSFSYNET